MMQPPTGPSPASGPYPAGPYPAGPYPATGAYPTGPYPPIGSSPTDRPPTGPPPGWGQRPPGGPPPGWGQQPPGGQPPFAPGGAWQSGPPGMVRKRRKGLLALGIVLTVAGLGGLATGILRIIDAADIPDDDIVARGRVGGGAVTFERDEDMPVEYTIYLDSDSSRSDIVEDFVDSTECTVTLPGGDTVSIDGDDLSTSVNLNGTANVGSFDAPAGTIEVACSSGFADGVSMLVVKGGPRLGLAAFAWLFGGIAVLVAGIVLTIVGSIRRWRPADPSTTVS